MKKLDFPKDSQNIDFASLKIFKLFNAEELKYLLSISEILEYSEKELIIEEGEISPFIYIIAGGTVSVKIKQKDFDGNESDVFISTIGKGDVIGEAAIFANVKRTANIVSNETVQLIRIQRDIFISFIKRFPNAGIKLLMFVIYSLLNKLREVNHELAFERKAYVEQEDIDKVIKDFIIN